jgi:hypothetical protein
LTPSPLTQNSKHSLSFWSGSFADESSLIGEFSNYAPEVRSSQVNLFQNRTTQVSTTQVSTTQVSIAQVNTSQQSTSQNGTAQVYSRELPLTSSISLQQFLSSHNYNLQNTTVPTWLSYLGGTTPFNLNIAVTDLPTGQLAEAQLTGFDANGRPNAGTLLLDYNGNDLGHPKTSQGAAQILNGQATLSKASPDLIGRHYLYLAIILGVQLVIAQARIDT